MKRSRDVAAADGNGGAIAEAECQRRSRMARFDSPAIRVLVLIHPTTKENYGERVMARTCQLLHGGGHTAKCTVSEVTAEQVLAGALRDADVLYVPGGSVACQQRVLGSEGFTEIMSFVQRGGGYVGICAGALLAGGWGVEHMDGMLGASTDWTGWTEATIATVTLTDLGRQILGCGRVRHVKAEETAETVDLLLTGGSWHVPCERVVASAVDSLPIVIARFEPLCVLQRIRRKDGTEVDPQEWGANVPAVAGCFGSGRVLVFGPHPESTKSDASAQRWLGEAIYWTSRMGILEQQQQQGEDDHGLVEPPPGSPKTKE